MERESIRYHVGEDVAFYRVCEPVNYVHWSKIRQTLKKIKPQFLQKPFLYITSLFVQLINLSYLFSLIKIILKERVDVVHVNNARDGVAAAILTRRKCIWHFHGLAQKDGIVSNWRARYIDRFVSISEHIKKLAVDVGGIDANRIDVIPNPITPFHSIRSAEELQALRRAYHINGEVVISVFGRLIEWKGQLEFLQALNTIYNPNLKIKVLIVGSDGEGFGIYRHQLIQFVEESNLGNVVTFAGFQQDVDPFYQISDIVVHSSIEPEPFGLVITEAMQNNCAVLASNHGAGPEIITHEVNGLIADPLDADEFGTALLRLIIDHEARQRLADQGKKDCNAIYSPEKVAQKFADVYDRALNR